MSEEGARPVRWALWLPLAEAPMPALPWLWMPALPWLWMREAELAVLQRRFPAIQAPKGEDICYATSNRQAAVKAIAAACDAMLVIGAPNSSNSQRLREVAAQYGCPTALLVQRASEIDFSALDGIASLGVTAGASAPEVLVDEIIDAFRARYDVTIETVTTAKEDVYFPLPRELREKV